ncbi:MAG: adenine deaminase C-terminal domain-containing protein [Desulfitobacteriaceae bacterium]
MVLRELEPDRQTLRERLGRVALGRAAADTVLSGGDVLNVYTGEIVRNQVILIAGGRIAYVGEAGDFPRTSETKVFDLKGYIVIPGLIDGHSHMDNWVSLGEYASWSLPGGTTTVITECPSPANGMGIAGVKAFIRTFFNSPQRLFTTAPMIPYLSAIREDGEKALSQEEMEEILTWPEVVGLGEIYWSRFINESIRSDVLSLMIRARSLGKTVEGHTAGARKQRLGALAALGFDSCHEPITAEEVRERLRLGLATMIREGSIRRELETVIGPLMDMKLDLRKAMLVSDGVWPHHLVQQGHMDFIVNKAIALGLAPITAIQMATLNVAEHFHLDDELGGIAPGKKADLVVTPSLEHIEAKLVFIEGCLTAQEGCLTVELSRETRPTEQHRNLKITRVGSGFFRIETDLPKVRVRTIELITDIVTREMILDLPVIEGAVDTEGFADVLKVAVIDRYSGGNRCSFGFMKGFGLQRGAVGSSFSFDEGNLVVIGTNDQDMAAVVNRIKELNGGIVYCVQGEILAELPLPNFGTVSDLSIFEVAKRLEDLLEALKANGCHQEHNPLLTIFTTTFSAIPSIRLSVNGYWLAKENRYGNIFV